MTKALRKACNTAIPRKHISTAKVPWWDSELEELKKRVNKARRKFQKEKHMPEVRAILEKIL